jgi:(2Fe-2S) ferredoxin
MAPANASALSNNPADKLFACLNYSVITASADYISAPLYFDACRAWYDRLSWEDRGIVALVINAYTDGGEIVAERIAADLPPAPRCPF